MKTRFYVTIALAVALTAAFALTGCAAGAAPTPVETPSAATPSAVSAAVEANSGTQEATSVSATVESALTPEQIAAEERERKDEIERQYAMYEPFGLTYDRDKDLFFYEGKTVRYFKDTVNLWNTNGFFYENGVVDLAGKRDDAGELIGLVKATQKEFDARTAENEWREREFGGAIAEVSEAVSYEWGDDSIRDNSLDPYKPYGVSYDEAARTWMFGGRPIHIFYDEHGATYLNGSEPDGINVMVVCDSKGKIDRIVEMAAEDISRMVR